MLPVTSVHRYLPRYHTTKTTEILTEKNFLGCWSVQIYPFHERAAVSNEITKRGARLNSSMGNGKVSKSGPKPHKNQWFLSMSEIGWPTAARVEHILSRYQRSVTEAGERTNNGAGGDLAVLSQCTKFTTCKQLLQTVDRLVEENNSEELSVTDMTKL
ncbi:K-box region and MADS-box transcription factor family protein [Artemisia annua]|uniref:K-box region and MADS-box transcription factor family protein n=1 Tax=Artemisia annua TaxID=35608 RepID=A0A2U1P6I9_ARTAN|nr:K-box region and MADS-box transcription factor family protein [Artemisia annua]